LNTDLTSISTLIKLKPYHLYAVFLLGALFDPILVIVWNAFSGQSLLAIPSITTDSNATLISTFAITVLILFFTKDYLVFCWSKIKKHTSWLNSIYGFALGLVYAVLVIQMMAFFPPPPEFSHSAINQFLATPGYPRTIAILCIIFIAPLIEEYVFRGYVYDGIRHKKSATFTIFVTSVLFALPHMAQYYAYWPAALLLFGLGVLLAILRERYESLLPSILLHVAYNLTMLLFRKIKLERLNQT